MTCSLVIIPVTQNAYGDAYQDGFNNTVHLLIHLGISPDEAEETAQDAWTLGWENIAALPAAYMVRSWVNFLALNLCRSRGGPWREPRIEMDLEAVAPFSMVSQENRQSTWCSAHIPPHRRGDLRMTASVGSRLHRRRLS